MASAPAPTSGMLALAGRIVTMDKAATVLSHGVVYVRDGVIVAVSDAAAPPPSGFESVTPTKTSGTVFPGLIELHNHLPYDVLPLWNVGKEFTNRDQWSASSSHDYHRLVSGPMGVLGRNPDVVPAIVRYVEVRCLLAGTTTSQGVALAVDSGIVKLFRGLVRNVESTGDPALPPATTHIADVDSTDAERFLARLSGKQKLLLHLSEGTDTAARSHFLALQISSGRWAITDNLIGIHCAALTKRDFGVFARHGGSMVWSPLSNLLLYGATARLGDAIAEGVPVALGSDWAPSGSKNLLGELKVARLAADGAGATLTSQDLVAMVTRTPAQMLGWGDSLGTLEAGKKADLVVVHGTAGDPYDSLIDATEAELDLVVIDGVPRAGLAPLMTRLGVTGERLRVGGRYRTLNLEQTAADPTVAQVSVADSQRRLAAALADLPNAAEHLRATTPANLRGRALLAVSGVIDNGMTSSPHLRYRGRLTGPNLPGAWTSAVDDQANDGPLPALPLGPLTAVDDKNYYRTLAAEKNLPQVVSEGLGRLGPT